MIFHNNRIGCNRRGDIEPGLFDKTIMNTPLLERYLNSNSTLPNY